MPYTSDPANSATDRIRLRVGDTYELEEELSDAEYQYYIDITSSEDAAVIEVLRVLVAKYAQFTRERAGQVEVYGQDRYKNYNTLLNDMLDPLKGVTKVGPGIAGGISKSRVDTVRKNKDSNYTGTYLGWSTDSDFKSSFQED